jgi:hypothetical protein
VGIPKSAFGLLDDGEPAVERAGYLLISFSSRMDVLTHLDTTAGAVFSAVVTISN